MNGRIYDPAIGRFLSADPFVQFPESTQGFNRYTYVGNNPLSANDPSGYFLDKLKENFGIIGAIVGAAACVGMGPGCAIAAGAITGAVGGYLSTGSLEGALAGAALGAASAYIANQIGTEFGKTNFSDIGKHLSKSLAHGLSQGVLSKAGGGRFGDGFLGAFASNFASPAINGIEGKTAGASAARVTAAAVIGGTASHLGGGKFGNGAITAAFVQAYNHERVHKQAKTLEDAVNKAIQSGRNVRDRINNADEGFAQFDLRDFKDESLGGLIYENDPLLFGDTTYSYPYDLDIAEGTGGFNISNGNGFVAGGQHGNDQRTSGVVALVINLSPDQSFDRFLASQYSYDWGQVPVYVDVSSTSTVYKVQSLPGSRMSCEVYSGSGPSC